MLALNNEKQIGSQENPFKKVGTIELSDVELQIAVLLDTDNNVRSASVSINGDRRSRITNRSISDYNEAIQWVSEMVELATATRNSITAKGFGPVRDAMLKQLGWPKSL